MNSIDKIFWGEFLDLYESMPSLWKIKSPEYNNRDLKNQCYNKMVEKLKEFDPDANRDKVVKKINVFRTNYKRALNKDKTKQTKSASSLWYYDKLQFLEDQDSVRVGKCSMDTDSFKIEEDRQPSKKKQKKKETVTTTTTTLPSTLPTCITHNENEYITIAKMWANELRKMVPEQQLFAKKAINQILFEGQLGTLHSSSIQINTCQKQTYDSIEEQEEETTAYEYLTTELDRHSNPIETTKQTFDYIEENEIIEDHEFESCEIVKKSPQNVKEKRKWMKDCFKQRDEFTQETFLRELQECKPNDFRHFFNLDGTTFEALLEMVRPVIERKNTMMRDAISPSQRLAITLRYLATGDPFEQLKDTSNTSPQSIGKIVVETCQALIDNLKDYIKTPQTPEEWQDVAQGFQHKWNFPNCLGAVDAKHLTIKKPPNSGAHYHNYKKFYSIVFMAVVNSDYEFIMVDADINGGLSHEEVLEHSNLGKALQDNTLNMPEKEALPYSDKVLPFVFVGNDGFALSEHIMMPYSHTNLGWDMRIYNYRIDRTRRIADNAMGIMISRFGVLQRLIALSPEKAQTIVLACCHLHNYLRRHQDYISPSAVDWEDMDTSEIIEGTWRAESNVTSLSSGEPVINCINATPNAKLIRDLYCNYFSNEGQVTGPNKCII